MRKDGNQPIAESDNGAKAPKSNGAEGSPMIDQVRELLFGEANRNIDSRLADLTNQVNRQYSEIMDRSSQLEARIVAAQKETEDRRLSTIEDIGEAITKLGASVRNLSTARKG